MLRVARLHTVCQHVRQLSRCSCSAKTLKCVPSFNSFTTGTGSRLLSAKSQISHDGREEQTSTKYPADTDDSFNTGATSAPKVTSVIDLEPLRAHLREQGQPHDLRSFLLREREKQLKKDAAESLKATAGLTSKSQPSKRLSSTVFTGTRYEYLTQTHLASLGFELLVVGGRGDAGVDLIGLWTLPDRATLSDSTATPDGVSSTQRILKVLAQCKRLAANRTPTPSLIRELEGTISNATPSNSGIVPASFRRQAVGVMVCTRPATEGILKAMRSSRKGLVWIWLAEDHVSAIPAVDAEDTASEAGSNDATELDILDTDAVMQAVPGTRVLQMTWNAAASQAGLEGLTVGMRYGGDGAVKDAVLMWQGRPVN